MQTIWLIIQESDVKACIENLLLGSIVATSDRILVDKRNDIGCKSTLTMYCKLRVAQKSTLHHFDPWGR